MMLYNLTNDESANDYLRREISRQRCLRKFVEPTPASEVNAQAQLESFNER